MIRLDFETRSKANIKKVGAFKYAHDPSTRILCLAYKIDNQKTKLWIPGDPDPDDLIEALPEHHIEAHNSLFERLIWKAILEPQHHIKAPSVRQWTCSAAKAAALALPRSLDGVSQALDLIHKKDMAGHRIMLKMSKPRKPSKHNKAIWFDDPEDYKKLYSYCMQDVKTEKAVSNQLRPLTPIESKIWRIDQNINTRGVACDIESVKNAIFLLKQKEQVELSRLKRITKGKIDSPKQVDKMAQFCNLPNMQKDTVDNALKKKLPKKIRKVLKIRQSLSRSSVAKFQAMVDRCCDDNRIRDLLLYHGATTGRWTGTGIQIQNFPRGYLKPHEVLEVIELIRKRDYELIEILYGDLTKVLSSCLRSMLVAPEGKIFYSADYNAIEARVLLWLVNDQKGLNLFRTDQDIYKDLAVTIYDSKLDHITKEQREVGKRGILGLGFGMAEHKFQFTLMKMYRIHIDIKLANKVKTLYRKKYWRIKEFWNDVNDAAMECIETKEAVKCGRVKFYIEDDFLFCKLPSGRDLAYYKPQLKYIKKKWGTQLSITFMGFDEKHKWTRIDTYGGKLTENIVQGLARDIMSNGMINVEKADYPIVLSVHDELVSETDENKGSVEEYENQMCMLPKWAKGLPIKADGWKGNRYRK